MKLLQTPGDIAVRAGKNPWVRGTLGVVAVGAGTVLTPMAGVASEVRPNNLRQQEPVQLVSHDYRVTTTNNAIVGAANQGCAFDIVYTVDRYNRITNGWLNASSRECWNLVSNTPLGISTGGYLPGQAGEAGINELQFNLQPGQVRVSTQRVHGNWDNFSWLDSGVIYNPFNHSIPRAYGNNSAYNIGNLNYQSGLPRLTHPDFSYGNGITCLGGTLRLGNVTIGALTCRNN
jgi:hypothetical protein